MNLYTTLDMKAEVYQRPFCEQTDASAKRAFALALRNADSLVGQAPEDFAVFRIGNFDDLSGILKTEEPFLICRGSDFVMGEHDAE